jgi:hypothetical protein
MAKTKDGKEAIAGDIVRAPDGSHGWVLDGGAFALIDRGDKKVTLPVGRSVFVFRPTHVVATIHSRDGLYFDLLDGDRVRVMKTIGGRPENGGDVVSCVELDAGTWTSVVAQMTSRFLPATQSTK